MQQLKTEIDSLGLKDVCLLALVTDTSYDVSFYADINGKKVQSNAIAEMGLIDPLHLDHFYQNIAQIIRNASAFHHDSMNVVEVRTAVPSITYHPKDCRVYAIKKQWKESL